MISNRQRTEKICCELKCCSARESEKVWLPNSSEKPVQERPPVLLHGQRQVWLIHVYISLRLDNYFQIMVTDNGNWYLKFKIIFRLPMSLKVLAKLSGIKFKGVINQITGMNRWSRKVTRVTRRVGIPQGPVLFMCLIKSCEVTCSVYASLLMTVSSQSQTGKSTRSTGRGTTTLTTWWRPPILRTSNDR